MDIEAVFRRDGIAVLRGALRERLPALLPAARHLQARVRRELPSGTRLWRGGADPPAGRSGEATWGINEITRRDLFDPVLLDALAAPALHAAIHAILDRPRAWGMKMLWNPTWRPYDLHWHRDCIGPDEHALCACKPPAHDHLQFNAALTRDRSFRVVPGTHRRALSPAELAAVGTRAALPGETVVELEPGDVLLMDAHALHRGSASVEEDRLSLHYSLQAAWVPLAPWGDPEEQERLRSPAFAAALDPAIRPFWERLADAAPAHETMDWLRALAQPPGVSR
jgi:hypothetical protein